MNVPTHPGVAATGDARDAGHAGRQTAHTPADMPGTDNRPVTIDIADPGQPTNAAPPQPDASPTPPSTPSHGPLNTARMMHAFRSLRQQHANQSTADWVIDRIIRRDGPGSLAEAVRQAESATRENAKTTAQT